MKKLKLAALLLSFTFLFACSTNNGTANANPASNDQVTIGLHFELSGPVADYGNAESKGAKLALKLKNQELGQEKYTFVEYDNKSDHSEAVTVATLLSQSNVVGVVGPATSGASAATYPIMDAAGINVVSPSATLNNVTLRNPDDLDSGVYPHIFRVTFEDAYQGSVLAKFAKDNLNASKVVIYGDNSSEYSKGLIKAFTEKFDSLGGQIVQTEYYTAGESDFSFSLTNIKNLEFDVLYIAGYYNEAGLIIKQAREMGINHVIIGADGFDSESLVSLAGASNLNNVFYSTGYSTVDASEKLSAFIEAYRKEYNEEPSLFQALAFDSANVIIQAVEKVGNDRAKVREEIEKINFDGVTGQFTFDATHTPVKSVLVVELVEGKQSKVTSVHLD